MRECRPSFILENNGSRRKPAAFVAVPDQRAFAAAARSWDSAAKGHSRCGGAQAPSGVTLFARGPRRLAHRGGPAFCIGRAGFWRSYAMGDRDWGAGGAARPALRDRARDVRQLHVLLVMGALLERHEGLSGRMCCSTAIRLERGSGGGNDRRSRGRLRNAATREAAPSRARMLQGHKFPRARLS